MDNKKKDSKTQGAALKAFAKNAFGTVFSDALPDYRSVYKTLVQISKESGIPYKTLKTWFEERRHESDMAVVEEVKDRVIRRIPLEVDKELRIEAAEKNISVNDLVVKLLTKEARRLEKKRG